MREVEFKSRSASFCSRDRERKSGWVKKQNPGGITQTRTCPVVIYQSLKFRIHKKVYCGDSVIGWYWYLDDSHTQIPVSKFLGIGIWLKYQHPCFGVRAMSPTDGWILPNRLVIADYMREPPPPSPKRKKHQRSQKIPLVVIHRTFIFHEECACIYGLKFLSFLSPVTPHRYTWVYCSYSKFFYLGHL